MNWHMVNSEIEILNRHKKDIICDLCIKRIWFFQKAVRCVIRTKENIWAEYYHIKCLEKRGLIRRIKTKAGRWDDRDPQGTTNVIH